jgi:hypothetical protein
MKEKDKQIAELTHALNELYEVSKLISERYHLGGITRPKLAEALKQADKLLEGN